MKHIKQQFSIFSTNPDLVYIDNAATALVPDTVVKAIATYYTEYPANIHRGLYDISTKATRAYESSRKKVADFIGAKSDEIIFTSGTTFGCNMIAQSLKSRLTSVDNIVITRYEHHANLLPWQKIAQEIGCELRIIDIIKDGEDAYTLDMQSAQSCIDSNTKVVSIAYVSHVLGTITPVNDIIALAKTVGAISIVDAAQAVSHMPINVKDLDCDFLVFSGHKMYGPTGIGVVYGKKERLSSIEPYLLGGGMVKEVTDVSGIWKEAPEKFEAGTPPIASVIGLASAIDFIRGIGWENLQTHEKEITMYAHEKLKEVVDIIGPIDLEKRIGVFSFTILGIHPHDIAEVVNRDMVAIRAGHHCAIPLMTYLGVPGAARVSFAAYNTKEDIDILIGAIKKVKVLFTVK
ncbi:MAG: cysteine desulfurase [Candidatus Magasanikbacteria bacterium]|nr:cysteine desulfurase [Candidatus Magasanikbacteria bacterium]